MALNSASTETEIVDSVGENNESLNDSSNLLLVETSELESTLNGTENNNQNLNEEKKDSENSIFTGPDMENNPGKNQYTYVRKYFSKCVE